MDSLTHVVSSLTALLPASRSSGAAARGGVGGGEGGGTPEGGWRGRKEARGVAVPGGWVDGEGEREAQSAGARSRTEDASSVLDRVPFSNTLQHNVHSRKTANIQNREEKQLHADLQRYLPQQYLSPAAADEKEVSTASASLGWTA
jgi:hypothetical protein